MGNPLERQPGTTPPQGAEKGEDRVGKFKRFELVRFANFMSNPHEPTLQEIGEKEQKTSGIETGEAYRVLAKVSPEDGQERLLLGPASMGQSEMDKFGPNTLTETMRRFSLPKNELESGEFDEYIVMPEAYLERVPMN